MHRFLFTRFGFLSGSSFRLTYVLVLAAVAIGSLTPPAAAQQSPNVNASYRQLRTLLPAGEKIGVEHLVLKRDAATFTFVNGQFALFGEVNGRITGAVFEGTGHFHLTPPTAIERRNLTVLTKRPEFDEDFTQLVLRFTDETAAELRKASFHPSQAKDDREFVQAAMEFHTFQREHLFENVDLRLLQDVLNTQSLHGGFFLAAIKGGSNPHILFEIDPFGVPGMSPEEVRLAVWNQWGWNYPAAFHLGAEYPAGTASGREENATFKVENEELDTTIEKSGFLGGHAVVHLHSLQDGLTVVPLALFPSLRVSKVEGEHGELLDFVQEKKEEDADFGLVLARPLKKGETATVQITYGGKDAVRNMGNDNFNPIARSSWYPNGSESFGNYASYKMTFHVPKEVELIATGTRLSDHVDGKVRTSEWDSKMPLPVAGFHLGRFVEKDAKTPDGLAVAAYANAELPEWAQSVANVANGDGVPTRDPSHINGMAVGNLNTIGMLPVELSQGAVAAQIYESYFGKLPFDHVALTQQPACNFGQSWPMLVYLPICGFWDATIQNQFGLRPDDQYWKTVTAHEVAHQWWGQTVGFDSYRDQWMSEGFADASAGIFLQSTHKTPNESREYWRLLKTQLTEKNTDGFRPIDVGPVTMGYRLSSPKTGWNTYNNLVYPKGAYILHMVRMMMTTAHTGDEQFRVMMHDFVDTYRLKVATTEDFKAVVEKHMTPLMDADQNHRMDWFFNEYVYGTDLPHLHFDAQLNADGDKVALHYKLTQSGVPDSFKMPVPIYVELSDGRVVRLGAILMVGNTTTENTQQLPKPPIPFKRAMIDYMHDVLAIEN